MKVPISLIERLEDIKMQADLIEQEFIRVETNKEYSNKQKMIKLPISDKNTLGDLLLRVTYEHLSLKLDVKTPVIEDNVL